MHRVEGTDHTGRINRTGQLVVESKREGTVKDKGQVLYLEDDGDNLDEILI